MRIELFARVISSIGNIIHAEAHFQEGKRIKAF